MAKVTPPIPGAIAPAILLAVLLAAGLWGAGGRAAIAQQAAPQQPAAPGSAPAPPRPQAAAPAERPAGKEPAVKPSESPAAQSLVGLNVYSSDGTRVGEVKSVSTGPSGEIVRLFIRTGGFLGFGGRIVSIPEGRFMRTGQMIRLNLDSDQVNGLPEVKE